ncbi:hypothetical protein EFL77_08460 [Pediococcus pentosaceus]|uniref:hypothetical protein n=1 Tax=Pediococcus pentosaceus TaxID=1255 RepID=UPI00223C168D|nr:hypothetical protein [Pediococcus pentosaceus]MCT1178527.1 hypothetical protein [Pediococcus pentosaceus]
MIDATNGNTLPKLLIAMDSDNTSILEEAQVLKNKFHIIKNDVLSMENLRQIILKSKPQLLITYENLPDLFNENTDALINLIETARRQDVQVIYLKHAPLPGDKLLHILVSLGVYDIVDTENKAIPADYFCKLYDSPTPFSVASRFLMRMRIERKGQVEKIVYGRIRRQVFSNEFEL